MYVAKEKQTQRYRKQTSGYQWGDEREVYGIKRYKLLCIE